MTDFTDYLLRLRKGSAASLNVKKLKEILATFDGWKTEEVRILVPSDSRRAGADVIGVSDDDVRNDLKNRDILYVSAGRLVVEGSEDYESTYRARDEKKIEQIVAIWKQIEHNTLPDISKIKSGSFVVPVTFGIYPGYNDKFEETKLSFRLYVVVKATRVTAPNGETFDVYGGRLVGMLAQTPEHFLRWAMETTDLMDTILDKLGMTAYVPPSERVREAKDNQTLGTCAICGRRHVVRGTKMVLHGYQRPGYGFIVGDCYGVDRDAYEVSADACRDYIGVLDQIREKNLALVERIQNDEVDVFDYMKGRRLEKVERGQPNFERVAQAKMEEVLREVSQIDKMIEQMNEKIVNWSEKPLITKGS